MRLIDADALYKSFGASGSCNNCPLFDAYKCQYYNEHTLMEFCERIDDAPTVDAVPVKHTHWVIERGETVMHCNSCGWAFEYYGGLEEEWNYCPHCGAKMDEVTEDDTVRTV